MSEPVSKPYPWCYSVNDRPVKIVATADGGADCHVFDFASGGFAADRRYFAHVAPGSGKDVDRLTEQAFLHLVDRCRADAACRRRSARVRWAAIAGEHGGYAAMIQGREYVLRSNAGAGPYTLLFDGDEVEHLGELPATWQMAP